MAPWSPQLHPTDPAITAANDLLHQHGITSCSPWRVSLASSMRACPPDGTCVIYLMRRTHRATDNMALDIAVQIAHERRVPLVVMFKLGRGPAGTNWRHVSFMIDGLSDVADDVIQRGACWALAPWETAPVAQIMDQLDPLVVVTDEDVMPAARRSRATIAEQLHAPMIVVDNDVVVPGTRFDRCEYAARTIRPRIHLMLDEHLRELAFPGKTTHVDVPVSDAIINTLRRNGCVIGHAAGVSSMSALHAEVSAGHPAALDAVGIATVVAPAGPRAAEDRLSTFVEQELDGYASRRNHPDIDGTSRLSSYLHYGHVSAARVVQLAREGAANGACNQEDIDAFVEELVVRRELAHNFVRFNDHASDLTGAPAWAQATLAAHASDPREWLYDLEQLTAANTHDPLWNAAQRQMMITGHMHGYVRMYWAKKILEWSVDPETAFAHALTLNDAWHLDGRDPNGIVGVAWAIAGVHDRPWTERPIFGTIRYMSLASTGRKFNSRAYIDRWCSNTASLF